MMMVHPSPERASTPIPLERRVWDKPVPWCIKILLSYSMTEDCKLTPEEKEKFDELYEICKASYPDLDDWTIKGLVVMYIRNELPSEEELQMEIEKSNDRFEISALAKS